ncbi:MAG TPA: MotA/TolQ/ExbB proton channel family protein [candidate division Zixibacteria bacterium]|nr:MotA/TolQ/ExbB proton channel family protein [candidate division Zixibacteria bacterium]
MVEYFNKGGFIMYPLLGLFVIGIAFTIVKLWLLMRATINSKRFFNQTTKTLETGGLKKAIEICEKTRGPLAALFHAGLERAERGLAYVERAIENEAAVQLGYLERGMIWLSTIISVAPMLGFLGTVQGMIIAFDTIAKAGDIVPSDVAGGISTALLTTFSGLAIAIPMQIFFNYFVNKVDRMVVEMEDYSNKLVEFLLDNNLVAK